MRRPPPISTLFPSRRSSDLLYKLARKGVEVERKPRLIHVYNFAFSRYEEPCGEFRMACTKGDRKSTRLNSSHSQISYAVFCLKKKITKITLKPRTTTPNNAT